MSGIDNNNGAGLDDVESAVSTLVEHIFDSLQPIATAMQTLWDRLEVAGCAPRSADLAVLRDVVIGELQRQGQTFNSAGVVVADGVLADCPRYLEWWRCDHKNGGPAQKVSLDLNPNNEYFYDYTAMEWYAVPRDRRTRWVYGPYLDYTSVYLYVCTFVVPVTTGRGVFLGIVRADVPVARLDAALLPTFTAGSLALALANAEGRVIVTNHADHVAGSKIRNGAAGVSRPVASTPWSLVALNGERY
jgi:hypothetical protein